MDIDLELAVSLDTHAKENMKADFIVIGGGVAGLSAANYLADQRANVVLIEEGSYPAHKICGEFLSPESLPILECWGIPSSASISSLQIVTSKGDWRMDLPEKAATATRYSLDASLADRAVQQGAQVITGAKVVKIQLPEREGDLYCISLATGEEWIAPSLLVSTGRLTSQTKPKFCYIGAKAHFEGINLENILQMHLMRGAYFGMASIGKGRINSAGIIQCTSEEALQPQKVLEQFFRRKEVSPILKALPKEQWMTAPVPEFGLRNPPHWPNAYFLGDAAGVIPPATGNGLAMGLTSGILAARCALNNQPEAYRTLWKETYETRIQRGLLLHRLFLWPFAVRWALAASKFFPSLPLYFYRSTRGLP